VLAKGFAYMAVACAFALPLYSQETRGQVVGRITDQSGAAIVGAQIKGTNTDTNVVTSVKSNDTGDYVLPFLIPGPYTVTVENEGFRTFVATKVDVLADEIAQVNAKMQVGAAAQSVEVVASAAQLDTADAAITHTVESRSIMELPLKDGNPLMLADLSPGVMNLATGGMTRPFDNSNASSMVVNGSRTNTSEYKIDGAPNTAGGSGKAAYIPPPGVVSEVKVQTTPFNASNGFATGGNINVILKSGTNRVHGQTYYFIQNPAFNANAFFSNMAGLPRANYRQNRWGVNGNGPMYVPKLYNGRNRTFWMYGYEGILDSLPQNAAGRYTVPTAAERKGDFSALLPLGAKYAVYDPSTVVSAGSGRYSRNPFPGNIVPASQIHTTASKIMDAYFPAPNVTGTNDGTNNYVVPLIEKNRFMSHVFRVDHNVSNNNRLFVRGSLNNRYQEYEHSFNDGKGYNYWRNNRGVGIDDVQTISPTLILNVRYNYTRYVEHTDPISLGLNPSTLGFSQNFVNQIKTANTMGMMLPDINISSFAELNAYSVSDNTSDIHALAFEFTKTKSNHMMNFGGEHRVYRDNKYDMGRSSGNLAFSTNWTRGPLDNSSATSLTQSLASFELGLPTGGYYDNNASYAQSYQVSGWYFQDAWKISPRLTVNLGIRWEYEVPTTERYDRAVRGFDFNATNPVDQAARTAYSAILNNPANDSNLGVVYLRQMVPASSFRALGGLTFVGVNDQPRRLWDGNPHDIMPRVSLAYQVNNRTVFRAGYGMFYDIARQSVDQTGFSRQTTLTTSQDNGQTFVGTLENPFPGGFLQAQGASLGLSTNLGQNVNPKYTHLLDPYVQRWQASVQRSMGHSTMMEIAYVGNRSTHLRVTRNNVDSVPMKYLSTLPYRDSALNTLLTTNVPNPFIGLFPAGAGLTGSTVQVQNLLRPFPEFTGGATTSNEGFAWYHSMQTRVEKRFSSGYMLTAAWTWSKFMEATSFLNNTDLYPAHAISDQDRSHRFVTSAIYELPFGRGKRWAASWGGVASKLVSGWQMQGIYQIQSGQPLGFGDILFYGDFKNIALPSDQRTINRWFNTDAGFEKNSSNTFVYHVRTWPLRQSNLRAQGLNWFDVSFSKNTRLSEAAQLQFRAEANNALNHTHFSTPSSMDPTSSAFGTITSTAQQPRNLQFGLKILF
jgi:hypothetical protein